MLEKLLGKSGSAGLEAFISSTQEFNRLSLGALEKLVNFHLEKLQSYTSLSFAQWRALLDIKDISGLQDYLNSRPQLAEELGKQLQDDLQALLEMSTSYTADAQKIFQQKLPAAKIKKAA